MANQKYLDQIAKLMILIVAGVDNNNSFYPDLDEDLLWKKITPNFINDCCRILSILFYKRNSFFFHFDF